MVKTPASDFSAEISVEWLVAPLPGPGKNRGRSALSKNFCQAMKFFVHVIVHVPSPVLASRSLLAARCFGRWQREPPMAGSIGFRYSFTMGNIGEQPTDRTAIRAGRLVVF